MIGAKIRLKVTLIWNEARQQWDTHLYKDKGHILEHFDCPFMIKVSPRMGFRKDRKTHLRATFEVIGYEKINGEEVMVLAPVTRKRAPRCGNRHLPKPPTMNEIARRVSELEKGKKQVDIAQIKEVLRVINEESGGKFYPWVKANFPTV